jgi:tetratricopeptide (TPR) repeat protein
VQRKYAVDRSEARSLDHRITSSALASGDTAVAMAAQEQVAESLPPRTPERRRALATALRLRISEDRRAAEIGLEALRREFPEAPELDELSVTLALRYQAEGEVIEAERLLSNVDGPRSAVERGYLMLAAGDSQGAGEAFRGATVALEPAAATEVIRLIGLLERLSLEGVELLSESAARSHRGDLPGALRTLGDRLGAVPEQDQAALLVAGARMAEAGGDEESAAALRQQVLERFADAPEAPEAILALARFRSREAVGVPNAIAMLENLILARPNSAIVPTARRELERLKGRPPGGAT